MAPDPYPFTRCLVDLLIVASWATVGFLVLWEIAPYAG